MIIILAIGTISCEKAVLTNVDEVASLRENAYSAQQTALKYISAKKSDSAFRYFQLAKEQYVLAGDSLSAAYSLLQLAEIYKQYNDYVEAEASSIQALQLVNDSRDTIFQPIIYNNLGIVYRNLHNYSAALSSYQNSLKLTADPLKEAIIQNNVANVLIDSMAYSGARPILQRQLALPELARDSITLARVLDNLGYVNVRLGAENGMLQMEQAFKFRQHLSDTIGQITSLMHMANSNIAANHTEAISYAIIAAQLSEAVNSADDQLEAVSFVIRHSRDPRQVANLSQQYLRVSDSLLLLRQRAKNAFAAMKYESKSAREQVAALETDRVLRSLEQQRQWLLYGMVMTVVIFGSTGFFFWLRIRHKKEKLREGYKVETRIAKKVHDELANDVYHAMAFVETTDLANAESKETLLDSLDGIYNRTRNISAENNLVDTGPAFPRQLKQMMEQYIRGEARVIANISDTIDWNAIRDIKKIAVYRVIHELLVNWKKHSDGPIALIKIEKDKGRLNIEYSDNGKNDTKELIPKNGLQNMENRIRSIGGTTTFDINPGSGFRVSIIIPI